MEDVLAGPLGEVVEWPGEDGFNLVADPGKDGEDGAIAEAKYKAEEVEEGDPKCEA